MMEKNIRNHGSCVSHVLVVAGFEALRRLNEKQNDQHDRPNDNQQGSSLRSCDFLKKSNSWIVITIQY